MGRPLDEKADIYSFAIVLWEIGTGHPFIRSVVHSFAGSCIRSLLLLDARARDSRSRLTSLSRCDVCVCVSPPLAATLDIPFHDATAQTFKRQICIENRRPPLTKLAQLPSLWYTQATLAICHSTPEHQSHAPLDAHPPLSSDLLQRCWNKNPEVRPPFLEIVAALDNIILEAAISDEIGRNFWKVEIGGLDEVLWERFFRSFCTLLSYVDLVPMGAPRPAARLSFANLPRSSGSVPYIDASDPKHILAKATFGAYCTRAPSHRERERERDA